MIRLAKRPVSKRGLDENIVPMINIAFLLLLFFIVAGNLGKVKHPDIRLPSSASEQTTSKQKISLFLTRKGELMWNQRTITVAELPKLISQFALRPGASLRLKADAHTKAYHLIPIMEELKKNHIDRLAIITVQSEHDG